MPRQNCCRVFLSVKIELQQRIQPFIDTKKVRKEIRKLYISVCRKEGYIAKFHEAPGKKTQTGGNYKKTLAVKFSAIFNRDDNVLLIDSGAATPMMNSEGVYMSSQKFDVGVLATVANDSIVSVGDMCVRHNIINRGLLSAAMGKRVRGVS